MLALRAEYSDSNVDREMHLCLKLRLPENWTSSKGDDVAGAGLGACVRMIGITVFFLSSFLFLFLPGFFFLPFSFFFFRGFSECIYTYVHEVVS
jgi:hypothetical protein